MYKALRKPLRKVLGKKNIRFTKWGYMKKKLGLNKIFSSGSSAKGIAVSGGGDIYGHTGSIVGKY